MSLVAKVLVVVGVLLVVTGLLWPWVSRLPLFRLPGDIVVERPGFRFYFPLVSSLLISVVLSAVLWLVRKLF